MKKYIFLFLTILCSASAYSQVGINILRADTSAILHLESTNRGLLFPRMTTPQRNAIVSPKAGLTIYNTLDSILQYYNGECWLNTWQKNCDDCAMNFRIADPTDTIDRVQTNTASTTLTVQQIVGNAQTIALYIIPNLPPYITASLSNYVVTGGSGTVTLTVNASIFATPGTYPIIVQAVCGGTIATQVYIVTVEPCIVVNVNTPTFNYNLQQAANLPTNRPICVLVNIGNGVEMKNDSIRPVFNSGTLHANTKLGINNAGALLATGGDGGVGGNFTDFGVPGHKGTHAINLTVATDIINNGYIYSGGGGGGSVGLGVNIPVLGNWALGGGGGGGAARGFGGDANAIGIPVFADGQDATDGISGRAGQGGIVNIPITIPISAVTITITPNVEGGDGGEYGQNGTSGNISVNFRVTVPIVGTIFNQSFPDPPVSNFPAGGAAGNAIKRNNNPLNGLIDGNYQTNTIKGVIGN